VFKTDEPEKDAKKRDFEILRKRKKWLKVESKTNKSLFQVPNQQFRLIVIN
jgi:hypothetical protein